MYPVGPWVRPHPFDPDDTGTPCQPGGVYSSRPIREQRLGLGLTLRQVAEEAGLWGADVSRCERGGSNYHLHRIRLALGRLRNEERR